MSAPRTHLERLPRSVRLLLVLGLVALLAFPFVGSTDFYTQMVARMMIMAIFAMSLDLLQGVTGLVSLGHAAYFGLAGYALAFLTPAGEPVSLWWTCRSRCSASGAGRAGHRLLRGAHARHLLHHGHDGLRADGVLPVLRQPGAGRLGRPLHQLQAAMRGCSTWTTSASFYYFTLACCWSASMRFLRRLLWSPFGRALAGIRVNEHRMRAMGFGTFGYKLAAFTLAGALAGLAGYLWGAQTGYVNPELMGFHMSAHAIMMVILGGMGNFAGAILGAFAFEYLLHLFKDLHASDWQLGKHWQLWMGVHRAVLFAPRGLLGLVERCSIGARKSSRPMLSPMCCCRPGS